MISNNHEEVTCVSPGDTAVPSLLWFNMQPLRPSDTNFSGSFQSEAGGGEAPGPRKTWNNFHELYYIFRRLLLFLRSARRWTHSFPLSSIWINNRSESANGSEKKKKRAKSRGCVLNHSKNKLHEELLWWQCELSWLSFYFCRSWSVKVRQTEDGRTQQVQIEGSDALCSLSDL